MFPALPLLWIGDGKMAVWVQLVRRGLSGWSGLYCPLSCRGIRWAKNTRGLKNPPLVTFKCLNNSLMLPGQSQECFSSPTTYISRFFETVTPQQIKYHPITKSSTNAANTFSCNCSQHCVHPNIV